MQVNLNSSVGQTRPNFKARFANDRDTQNVLKKMIDTDPVTTLAIKLALEDSPDKSLVKAEESFIPYAFFERRPTFEFWRAPRNNKYCKLKCSQRYFDTLLREICWNSSQYGNPSTFREKVDTRIFLDAPCHDIAKDDYYMKKAKEMIQNNKDINLVTKKKLLVEQISSLREKVKTIDTKIVKDTVEFIKKY